VAVACLIHPQDWPSVAFWLQGLRPVTELAPHHDVRWLRLQRLDLRNHTAVLPTLDFNLQTRWPRPERLPPGFDPGRMLSNAMNPGLAVRDLHRQGITGRGVSVAVIDYNVIGRHPEYADRLVAIHRLKGVEEKQPSMHGPAVLSLLAGRNCGTAPEARVYFVATTDPGGDAAEHARALDWILEQNQRLPAAERIRVVSISAAPSGHALHPYRNSALYDAACERAEKAGVLVIDATVHRGFIGPCALDPADPEKPDRCRPIPAKGNPNYFAGRVLCPTCPRTTAEEYGSRWHGYQFCGLQEHTLAAAGSSWSMPYAAGVAALAWQVRPDLGPAEMREFLRSTARVLTTGERVIDPPALIARVRRRRRSQPLGPLARWRLTDRSP
jgi:serine protease AprX